MPVQYDEDGLPLTKGFIDTVDALLGHLENVHFSGEFSDMKVRLSDGEIIDCHRMIVCGQCPFFKNALKEGRFQESLTGIINMPNDPPHAIKALLEFLYTGGYSVDKNLELSDKLLFNMEVLTVAVIYKVDLLDKIASQWIEQCLKVHWKVVIPILPDFSSILYEHMDGLTESRLWIHEALVRGPYVHGDLLLGAETWEDLWKYAEEFMDHVTWRMRHAWNCQESESVIAGKWLTKHFGAESIRLVKCPKPSCGVMTGMFFEGRYTRDWLCRKCSSELLLD